MPFRDSRLYRQAAEFAARMLKCAEEGFEVSAWIRRLGGDTTLRFDTLAEGRLLENELEAALVAFARELDHRHFASCILDACSRHYQTMSGAPAIGMAMKTALAMSTMAWLSGARGTGRAFAQYWDLVIGCSLLNQIEHTLPVMEAYGDGRCEATARYMDHDPDLLMARRVTDMLFGGQPFIHRSGLDSIRALAMNPSASLEALGNVLLGADPADQEVFRDTILARLPSRARLLWARLFVRVHLAYLTCDFRAQHRLEPPFGLFVFESFGIVVPPGLGPLHAIGNDSLIWSEGWLRSRGHHWRANLFVERPVVPLAEGLWATTSDGLLDSAAWWVEAALYHFADAREAAVDDAAFARAVSQPFEQAVRASLDGAGLRTGWITESGGLRWLDGATQPLARGCPGEVDAVVVVGGVLWVVECKCLQLPFLVPGRTRDMVARLSADDAQGYHRKLAAKVAWLQAQLPIDPLQVESVRGVLVLDRSMAGMLNEAPHPVIDAGHLTRFLHDPEDPESRLPVHVLEALKAMWAPGRSP